MVVKLINFVGINDHPIIVTVSVRLHKIIARNCKPTIVSELASIGLVPIAHFIVFDACAGIPDFGFIVVPAGEYFLAVVPVVHIVHFAMAGVYLHDE